MKQQKKVIKLYKSGKLWVTAAIVVGGMVVSTTVSADTGGASNTATPTDVTAPKSSVNDQTQANDSSTKSSVNDQTQANDSSTKSSVSDQTQANNDATKSSVSDQTQANNDATKSSASNQTQANNDTTQPSISDQTQANNDATKSSVSNQSSATDVVKPNSDTVATALKSNRSLAQTTGDTQTVWAREKSAQTNNSDNNPVSNEAGEYWPDTKGQSIKNYDKTETKDLLQTTTFTDGYNPTPVLKQSSDLSLYVKGQKVDIGTLQDDDSLGTAKAPNSQYSGHNSSGHSRLLKTSDLGQDTYFYAKDVMRIKNQDTNVYESYDMKWTLQSVNYSNEQSMIALGIKGSIDGGGTTLLNVGSGWQIAKLGNFFNTHIQFFKDINYADQNEHLSPDEAISQGLIEPNAVSIHFGVSDIDASEAIELTDSVIKKVYVDNDSQLAYQKTDDGYLAITRKYNDTSDVSDSKTATLPVNEKRVTILFEMDVPKEGFDYSIATIGTAKNKNGDVQLGQGSKVDPSLLSTMKYEEPLSVNFQDQEGTQLIPSKEDIGIIGDPYKTNVTQAVQIPGYHLVTTLGKTDGVYVDGNNEITHIYAKDQGTLVVNYVDEASNVLATADKSTADTNQDYTTTPKSIDDYDLVPTKTTGDVTGQYPADGQTAEVTYVYGKQGQHTTNYVDEDGNELVPAEQTQGPKDTDYKTTPAEVPGYHLVPEKTTGDETGKYDTGKTTDTTYVYAKDQGNLVVNYVDEAGNALTTADKSTADTNQGYTTAPKSIDGYDFVPSKTTGDVTGQYPADGQTKEVTYVYGKQGQHTTNYVDEDGQTVVPTDTTQGSKDTDYKTTPAEVPGYHLVPEKTTGDETGKYDTGKTTDTTYVYAKDQGNLVVNYVDEAGNALTTADKSTADTNQDYTTAPKSIDGYDLISTKTTGDVAGQYPADGETKEVTYVYGKQGQHTTNYVDEDGNDLVPAEQTQGPKDTDYKTTPAEVPGYHLVPEKTTGDETGKYDTGKTTDTTYVYAKDQGNLIVNYVDESGQVIAGKDSSTKNSSEDYTTAPKSIDGYDLVPSKTTGDVTGQYPNDGETKEVTYVYGKQGQHTTNYVDEDGNDLVPAEQTQGPKDTDYKTTPTEIPGYHLVPEKTTGDETGNYDTGKTTDTTYVYAKDQGNLVVNYVDEEGNTLATADKSTADTNQDYTTAPKSIDGYDLIPVKTTGDVAGQYPADGQTKEVTYVYGNQGQHTTNYVDEDGQTLVPTDTTNGPKDTDYKTTPTEIPGYHLVPEKTTGDETGNYDTGKTTDTTYVYAKDQGNLIVNYVDEAGNALTTADKTTADTNQDYTTTPKLIDGYDLIPTKTTGDTNGQYPADGQTKEVTYVYGKQGQHTTNYVDEDGNDLVPAEQTQGPKDTDYKTTPAEIPGYHLVPEKTTGDETGKYDTGKTTDTTYVYAKDQGNLVVNYVDESGAVLSSADSSTQDSGAAYTTAPKSIDGYDLIPVKTTGDVTGQYPADGETKEVTYVYGQQGQHTTNYVDEDGNELVPAEQTQGPKDTDYTTTPTEIPGYHLVPEKTTGDETGKYDTGKTTDTTYVYAKDQGNLVVNYVDEDGNALTTADKTTADTNQDYTTTPKSIDGYDLIPVKTTGDVTGQYPADGQTKEVTYVYGKQGQHTTNYVDEDGKVLVPTDTTNGAKDTDYKTTPAEIPGYHLVPSKTTGDETGKYDTGKTTDTTYVYAKDQGNLIVNYVDESGAVLSPADSSSKDSGEDYTTAPKSIDGYDLISTKTTGDVAGQYPADGQTKEVTYVYGKQGQHTTNYVDDDGNELVPAEQTQGPKDTDYKTTPSEIPGYHLVPEKTTGNETGKYDTGKTTDTTYVYAKDQGTLIVNYVDEAGNALTTADKSTADTNQDYTTAPKSIDGYDLIPTKTTGDVSGQYPADGQTKEVTYVYGQQGQHTTNYVDEDGQTLAPTDTTKGSKDTDYTATPTEIPGYHLVPEKTTGDETGKYDTGKTTDTTYVYAKDQGNLVVNYVDEAGQVLAGKDSSTKNSGEDYTTAPKSIDGYDLVPTKTTGDVAGQYPNDGETKEVTYVYGKQGQHTTNYVDEAGNELVPAEQTQGPKDTDYTATPTEIPGYHLVPEKTTGDETGKYDTDKTTDTTYVYAKDQGNLVVNYVDEAGNALTTADKTTADTNQNYTTAPKSIDGYDLIPTKTTGDVTGQYPNDGETKEVTYVYGKQGQHTTNYVDEDGQTLVPTDTTKGPKDTDYKTTPSEIPGYHLVPEKTTGDETGKYDTGKTTDTTYVYAKDQGNLVVNYVDEAGNALTTADKSTADSNQDYTTAPKSIDGYDLVPTKTTGDVTSQYPADGQTKEVTYVYGQQGQHTTNYVNEDGQTLVPTDTTKGPKDTDYKTTPAEVPGYHLVPEKTTGDETGKYDTGKTTDTTYVYAKDQGNLVVNYVDESGQVLAGKDSSTKNSGEDYTTTPKSIDGYDLVPSKTTGDVTGQYPNDGETKEVTYVYGKQGQHTTNYVDEDGNELVPAEQTQGPKDTDYTTTPTEIPGYHLVPEKTTGDETGKYDTGKTTDTTYVYAKDQGNLIVNYVDESGQVIAGKDSSTKNSGEDYTTAPKSIDGYDLVPSKTTGDVTGQYPNDGQTKEVTYVYGKQGQHTTNYVDEDGNDLVPAEQTQGPKDTDYTTTPTEIPGYHLVPSKTTGDETGKYDTGKTTDTTYVYAKDQVSKPEEKHVEKDSNQKHDDHGSVLKNKQAVQDKTQSTQSNNLIKKETSEKSATKLPKTGAETPSHNKITMMLGLALSTIGLTMFDKKRKNK